MVLINLCSRKRANLILIGTLMFFFGVTLLSGVSGVTSLRIIIVLLSLVYITTGPFLVVKGIMNRHKKVETEYCALCGKNITKLKKKPLYEKDGEKFCSDCKEVIEKDIENMHIVCSICGIDLTADDMNVVDDSLFCINCLSEKFGNIYSYM